jgi:hypothetical protein
VTQNKSLSRQRVACEGNNNFEDGQKILLTSRWGWDLFTRDSIWRYRIGAANFN